GDSVFIALWDADIINAQDYYPFGMLLPNRVYQADSTGTGDYRYAFNGMERDDEVSGAGNSYNFGARNYDPRIGRFIRMDFYTSSFPYYSPYLFAGNKPIVAIDRDGNWEEWKKVVVAVDENGKVKVVSTKTTYRDIESDYNVDYVHFYVKLPNGKEIYYGQTDVPNGVHAGMENAKDINPNFGDAIMNAYGQNTEDGITSMEVKNTLEAIGKGNDALIASLIASLSGNEGLEITKFGSIEKGPTLIKVMDKGGTVLTIGLSVWTVVDELSKEEPDGERIADAIIGGAAAFNLYTGIAFTAYQIGKELVKNPDDFGAKELGDEETGGFEISKNQQDKQTEHRINTINKSSEDEKE
ncbi:MAG: hypothetical protein KDC92_14380, partial [Bacteroidetes bacterium]|nr:hypothetical protein [Bacteroidota bacterium]